jgi:plastocyanin
MGNVDLFNGEGLETDPTWTLPGTLQPGLYSYYCRLHPGMRGALEVVPS